LDCSVAEFGGDGEVVIAPAEAVGIVDELGGVVVSVFR
jgi:hypothetical protein